MEEEEFYKIGHILQPGFNQPLDASIDAFRKEIALISENLHKKNQLSFINVALPQPSLLSLPQITNTLDKISHYIQQESHLRDVSLGIDLTSSAIAKLTPPQIQQISDNLLAFYHQHQGEYALTIASNYMTLNNAKKIRHAVKQGSEGRVTVLGTEILRLHALRPGQLSDDYRYMPYHSIVTEINQKEASNVKKAIADFNHAVAPVLKIENELLNKVKKHSRPLLFLPFISD